MMEFPCNRCGICCRNVHLSKETAFLNRSDGVCINFDELTHLCKIYENRPLVCRIREYYLENLSNIYTWDEFILINLSVCHSLQKKSNK